jgi:hypothetical protein
LILWQQGQKLTCIKDGIWRAPSGASALLLPWARAIRICHSRDKVGLLLRYQPFDFPARIGWPACRARRRIIFGGNKISSVDGNVGSAKQKSPFTGAFHCFWRDGEIRTSS